MGLLIHRHNVRETLAITDRCLLLIRRQAILATVALQRSGVTIPGPPATTLRDAFSAD